MANSIPAHADIGQLNAGTPTEMPSRTDCQGSNGYAAAFGGRRTFLWRPESLASISRGTTESNPVVAGLLVRAEAALKRPAYTVVDKTKLPASGDRHDYYSMGPYWWPAAGKQNGEPYVRKDGEVNPERKSSAFDSSDLAALGTDVSTLALAYHYSGDRRFANRAAELIRGWFLTPATRMNPNLDHAQAVPGIATGRGEGIIDAVHFLPIVESIGLLAPSGAISGNEQVQLEAWFGALVRWLETSANGRDERAKANNHGIYYDLLISQFSLFARKPEIALRAIQDFPEQRIAVQFAADGSLPEEAARTRSWHYTHWTMLAVAKIAGLGECLGVDLWSYETKDGRGLRNSLDWISRFVGNESAWPFKEGAFSAGGNVEPAYEIALESIRTAAWGYRDPELEVLASLYARKLGSAHSDIWLAPFPHPTQKP